VDSLISRGQLGIRRIGRRVLIPTEEFKRFATNLSNSDSAADSPVQLRTPRQRRDARGKELLSPAGPF
jgi:hypothetical protein